MLFLEKKGGMRHVSSRDQRNHDFPIYLKISILFSYLPILCKRKGSSYVPEYLIKTSVFLLYTENISGHLFYSRIRQIR